MPGPRSHSTIALTLDTVEAHSCVGIVVKFTDEQYTAINQLQDDSTLRLID